MGHLFSITENFKKYYYDPYLQLEEGIIGSGLNLGKCLQLLLLCLRNGIDHCFCFKGGEEGYMSSSERGRLLKGWRWNF